MLVLSRKVDQQIQIGDGVVITILQVKGNAVRIGIEAPREVRVLRSELEPKNDDRPLERVAQPATTRNPRTADERTFTIVRRSPESAVAERGLPNENRADEATPQDLELRLSRRSTMSALRGFVLPRR